MSSLRTTVKLARDMGKAVLWSRGIRQGSLSGQQRFLVAALGGGPDRTALALGEHTTLMPTLYGIRAWDYLNDPQLAVELEVRFCKQYGFDADLSATGTYIKFGCGPEMGTEWQQTGDDMLGCLGRLIQSRDDVDKLSVPDQPTRHFKNYLLEMTALNERMGGDIYLTTRVLSPFSAACFFRGFQSVVLDARAEPEFYASYMEKCVALSVFWGQHVLKTGVAAAALLEIYGTPDLVGPLFYDGYIAPYNDRVCQQLRGRVRDTMKHFMGECDDPRSQQQARAAYDAMFEREGPGKLHKALRFRLPGMPACLALTGEAFLSWPEQEILAYVREGLDLMREEKICPYVFLLSIAPGTDLHKLDALRDFLNNYPM